VQIYERGGKIYIGQKCLLEPSQNRSTQVDVIRRCKNFKKVWMKVLLEEGKH